MIGAAPGAPEGCATRHGVVIVSASDSSAATPTAPALDPEIVARLRSLADDDGMFLVDLRETFVTSSIEQIASVRAAIKSNDAESLCRAAHTFKGSSANVGATRLSALARSLEELGHADTVAGAADLLRLLDEEFRRVEVDMARQFQAQPS